MSVFEILIGLCIAAILAVMLVPNWQQTLERGQDDAVRDAMTRFMQRAYQEANLTKQTVIVCKSANQLSCGGEWWQGMLMYKDTYKNGELRETQQIIARYTQPQKHHQVFVRFYPHYHNAIYFNPILAQQSDNGSIWYCHEHASHPLWVMTINKLGVNTVTTNIPESYRCR